jgi:phage terminase large subunit-like protein
VNFPKEYYNKIKSGEIVACEEITEFYKRMLEEETRRQDRTFPYFFDERSGQYVIDFIEKYCKHYQGEHAGELVKLELFQKAFIQTLFGWLEKDSGYRRFREYFFEVARKHGKSFLSACIAVYMLACDDEAGAEVYTAATKIEQARIIYKAACNIIDQNPELSASIKTGRYETNFPMMKSVMKPLPAESKTLDGLNIHFAALDEIHEQKDRNMYDVLRQGMKARRQPLIGCITTSGFRREGLYDSLHDYACDVAKGNIKDDRFLPLVYKLDDASEWVNPKMWEKSNPGLGTIKSYVQLADDVERAKNDNSYLPTLLTKDFDMKQSETSTWLPFESVINESTFDMSEVSHSYAIGGCDLSSVYDLTCATLVIRKPNGNIYALQKYFIPQRKLDENLGTDAKQVPYKLWAEQGWLEINEGAQVDYSAVTKWFVEMVEKYDIRPLWICYDRALAGYWVSEMEEYGFEMEKTAQGPFTWSQPMKELGCALSEHQINYNNNPILRWCLANTGVKALNKDGIETIQPVKLQQHRRIDGMVSLLNAWVGYVKHLDEYLPYLR